jgi:hypothetical protein
MKSPFSRSSSARRLALSRSASKSRAFSSARPASAASSSNASTSDATIGRCTLLHATSVAARMPPTQTGVAMPSTNPARTSTGIAWGWPA